MPLASYELYYFSEIIASLYIFLPPSVEGRNISNSHPIRRGSKGKDLNL
jgi:hypothetical protein